MCTFNLGLLVWDDASLVETVNLVTRLETQCSTPAMVLVWIPTFFRVFQAHILAEPFFVESRDRFQYGCGLLQKRTCYLLIFEIATNLKVLNSNCSVYCFFLFFLWLLWNLRWLLCIVKFQGRTWERTSSEKWKAPRRHRLRKCVKGHRFRLKLFVLCEFSLV